MSVLASRGHTAHGGDWIQRVVLAAVVVAIGVTLGMQYMAPDKRVLATMAALVMFAIGWRVDMVSGIGALLLAIPFPRWTSFGSTNLAFILGLFIIWLLRYSQRTAAAPHRTPMDAPIVAMIIAYLISFYNVSKPIHFQRGLLNFFQYLACVIMFYLIVSNVRTEKHLRRLHMFQVASIGLIYLFCFWELAFPRHVLVPGWIDLTINVNPEIAVRNYRVGGPFFDYEHLSEFAAICLFFFIFLTAQARSTTQKVIFGTLIGITIFIELATITRGGLVAMLVGIAYLVFLMRRRIQFVPFVIVAGIAVALFLGLDAYIAHYTASGDVFARLAETKFVGIAPDSRAPVWPQAWERWMVHPLIGWGPYYSAERGIILWFWPHNLFLYVGNCFGFVGLAIFLWLLYRLFRLSTPPTDRLNDSYVKSFLLCAHVQFVVFLIDECKIEYLRSTIYPYEVWVFFSMLVAAHQIIHRSEAAAPAKTASPAPRSLTPARA